MSKKDVIETTAEEIKDQVDSNEESSNEEKGLEKAHPVKAFLGGIRKAIKSTPGKIVTGIVGSAMLIAAVGYAMAKSTENARPTGAEAFPEVGDGFGSDQSANENTEN